MQTLLVKIDSANTFNEFIRIVGKHFKKSADDFGSIRDYFFLHNNWHPLSFTHLAVIKEGATFPTTAGNVSPRTKVCNVDTLEADIMEFGVGDISIAKAEVYDLVEQYAKTTDDAKASEIKQRLIAAVEYANTADVAKEIATLVSSLLGKNGEEAAYFAQRASGICLLASKERDLFEPFATELDPIPNGSICKLVEEYATTEDFYRANSIHVQLSDMLRAANKNGEVLSMKLSTVGNMLVDRGDLRKNALHYAPIISLIVKGSFN